VLPRRYTDTYTGWIEVPDVGVIAWRERRSLLIEIRLLDKFTPLRGIAGEGYWLEYLRAYLDSAIWPPDMSMVDLNVLTPLQKRILQFSLKFLPAGKVVTYGNLARALGTHPRAVASALRANNLPIVLPCHRVVGYNSIGGFSAGLGWKRFLLSLEGVQLF